MEDSITKISSSLIDASLIKPSSLMEDLIFDDESRNEEEES